jgi:PEGA domain
MKSVPPPPVQQVTTAPMPMPVRPALGSVSGSVPPARSMEATAMVRPQQQAESKNWFGVGAGLLGACAIAAATVFYMMPRTGTLSINVSSEKGGSIDKVTVYVDGKEECGTTPCAVKKLESGSHSVKVVAQGFETPEVQSVTVESGKEASVSFRVSKGGSGSGAGTGVRVSSAMSGLKLSIDGELVGALPQDVKDLSAGDHKIKISGGDRYAALEKTITVAKGEMIDLSNIALKVLHGKATIDSATPGAKVTIVSGSDRRELPKMPLSIELDTAKSWILEGSKLGMNDFKQPIVFDDGQAEKNFTVSLEAKGAPQTQVPVFVAVPNPNAGGAGGAGGTKPDPTPPATAKTATTATAAAAAGGGGEAASGQATLNINSIPASNILLDGKPIGQTPKMGVSVSSGAHTVTFKNTEFNLTKAVSVSVKSGETKSAFAKLRD